MKKSSELDVATDRTLYRLPDIEYTPDWIYEIQLELGGGWFRSFMLGAKHPLLDPSPPESKWVCFTCELGFQLGDRACVTPFEDRWVVYHTECMSELLGVGRPE